MQHEIMSSSAKYETVVSHIVLRKKNISPRGRLKLIEFLVCLSIPDTLTDGKWLHLLSIDFAVHARRKKHLAGTTHVHRYADSQTSNNSNAVAELNDLSPTIAR